MSYDTIPMHLSVADLDQSG